ncbi:hypothetical protein [uncultured Chryseobacterium sp.]|uniref:hypothetical protein n=1 Tax=uncultured Chryseobacterium sp. TaxID=259322 RepID=UPI0025CB8BC3|nr:hypothetical protein [uncultured Chryseobacterium sp.]
MLKKIKINQTIAVYSDHKENSETGVCLYNGNIVDFNRVKHRNGIDWIEIFFQNKKAYIKKDFSKIYILKRAKLLDDACTVIFYQSKKNGDNDFHEMFTIHRFNDRKQEAVVIKRIFAESEKEQSVTLYYNPEEVDVSKRIFAKGEEMIITGKKGMFLEVLYGRKQGYILSEVSYYELRNRWMFIVAILVTSGVFGGSLYAVIETGWSVRGSLLAVPAVVISIIIIAVLKLILSANTVIFNHIRKRF